MKLVDLFHNLSKEHKLRSVYLFTPFTAILLFQVSSEPFFGKFESLFWRRLNAIERVNHPILANEKPLTLEDQHHFPHPRFFRLWRTPRVPSSKTYASFFSVPRIIRFDPK